jgi:hypothetical protein
MHPGRVQRARVSLEAELAKLSIGAVMTTVRESTKSELAATYYRRIVAVPIAMAAGWLGAFFGAGIVIFVVSGITGVDAESVMDQHVTLIGWLVTALVVAGLLVSRRRLIAAADETGAPTFPRPSRAKWSGQLAASPCSMRSWDTPRCGLSCFSSASSYPASQRSSSESHAFPLSSGSFRCSFWPHLLPSGHISSGGTNISLSSSRQLRRRSGGRIDSATKPKRLRTQCMRPPSWPTTSRRSSTPRNA